LAIDPLSLAKRFGVYGCDSCDRAAGCSIFLRVIFDMTLSPVALAMGSLPTGLKHDYRATAAQQGTGRQRREEAF
jgi:hypothetical protein